MAYYTTSYIFNNSTTSTAALEIWRALSLQMEHKMLPMTAEELTAATALSEEYIDNLFRQSYYQKHYGFRKFETLEAFREWATSTGVFYNPELHARKPEPALAEADEADAEEEEEEELDEAEA